MNFIAYCDGISNIFEICKLINCKLEYVLEEYALLKGKNLIS